MVFGCDGKGAIIKANMGVPMGPIGHVESFGCVGLLLLTFVLLNPTAHFFELSLDFWTLEKDSGV